MKKKVIEDDGLEEESKAKAPNFYRISLAVTEDMLGTAPANPEIYSRFVADKALKDEKKLAKTEEEKAAVQEKQDDVTREELAMLPEDNAKGITVFRRDPTSGALILTDTMIRGFLKEGAAAIGLNGATWGMTTKIDRFVFVTNKDKRPIRVIPIIRDGAIVTAPDDIYERPLRAMTMQGPRVTLAASERVRAPFSLEFYIYIVGLGSTDKGKITPKVLKEWLDYGVYCGLGQYRTGGHGRFDAIVEPV